MFGFKALVLLTCLSWSHCKLDKYCSVCEDHTMCKYHTTGEDCVDIGGSGVTEHEKKEILAIHNWLRRIVALGYETRGANGTQPKAANLMKLTWDDELSKVAQRWADQCRFEHDSCRNDPRWKVGQNIYWKWMYPTHHINWTEAILSWYNEVSLYNPKEVNAYRFEPSTGHYTQMLWHDTYVVGCGRRDYGPNKLYVCNYGPAGNWIGEPMYVVGEPCSKCPHGTVCDEFLCAYKLKASPEKKLIANTVPVEVDKKTENDVNKTSNLEVLKPPSENATDVYSSEGGKVAAQETANSTQGNGEKPKLQNRILVRIAEEEEEEKTTNSIDTNELDSDTLTEIEELKHRIEQLVKNAIKKVKTNS